MERYGQTFKDRAGARLLPPESETLELVSKEVGVASGTLQRWRDDVQSVHARPRAGMDCTGEITGRDHRHQSDQSQYQSKRALTSKKFAQQYQAMHTFQTKFLLGM